jgi:hypothetical protein
MSDIAEIYPLAFTHGRVLERNGRTLTFAVAPVGRVSLPSGRIVACDPLVTLDLEPFVQAVIPGRYIVDLALMREEGKGEQVAMARVRFTSRQPAVWVMALRKGEKLSSLGPGGYFGYTSESGTGAFLDATAFETADFAHLENIDDLLLDLTGNYQPYRYWMEYTLDRRLNVVMFSSGPGAGRYGSYFGIDANGDVCALVTDFNLIS